MTTDFHRPRSSAIVLAVLLSGAISPLGLFAEDLTPKVLALFEAKCQECHHPDTGDEYPYFHKDIDIAALLADEVIIGGKPEESSAYERIILPVDEKKRMPKSRGAAGEETYRAPLTADEQKLVKDWIMALANGAPQPTSPSVTTAPATPAAPAAPAARPLTPSAPAAPPVTTAAPLTKGLPSKVTVTTEGGPTVPTGPTPPPLPAPSGVPSATAPGLTAPPTTPPVVSAPRPSSPNLPAGPGAPIPGVSTPGLPLTPSTPALPDSPAVTAKLTAVSADPNVMPSNLPNDQKVHWIFEQRCSKCHSGDYEPELHGTVNLMNFFNEKDSTGTNMLAESVVERVIRDHTAEGRMPKSKGMPGETSYRPPLAPEERAALQAWIDSGRPKTVKREILSQNDVINYIYDDLQKTSEAERRYYRYFTFTNLYNATDAYGNATVGDLNPHRAGVGKLINSLSMNARVTPPYAIDQWETVYRIDLRDYNWTAEDWEYLIYYYPYGIIGVDRRKENLIAQYTGSQMSYVRADWFTFAAAQPPLYDGIMDRMLGIHANGPDDDVLTQLCNSLGVDRIGNIRNGLAMRAGFQYSGVSGANRLIERHDLGKYQGALWVSYDFTPHSPKRTQELYHSPLGPPDAGLTSNHNHVFEHDGGEMVYNLPNGLQGYMLTTNTGKRLVRGPIEIVQDSNRPDSVILNGISCMACHDQGIRPAIKVTNVAHRTLEGMTDEIKPLVEAAGTLDFNERGLVERLYVDPPVLQAAVKKDFERFVRAEAEATAGKAGATEPVVGLYNDFRAPVTARKLASEFGLSYEELLSSLKEKSHESETLSLIYSKLSRDIPERRESLMREYISIIYALGYELMPFTPLGYEDFGGEKFAQLIKDSDEYQAVYGGGNQQYTPEYSTTNLLTSKTAADSLATESVLIPGGGKLKISIQPKLTVGERANLEVVATDDVHVRIFHFSSDEFVTELYPGSTGGSTLRPRNKKLTVSWETTAPGGAEQVVVYASKGAITNVAKGEKVGDFTVYQKEALYSSRGIPKAIKAAESTDTSYSPSTAVNNYDVPAEVIQATISYLLKDY